MKELKTLFKKVIGENSYEKLKKLRYHCIYKVVLDQIEKKYNLIYLAQREAEKKFFRVTPTEIENVLKGQKIAIFDIGARGGLEDDFRPYEKMLEAALIEPDPVEADALESKGYFVVKSLLGERQGKRVLNVGHHGGTSSYFLPDGQFLEMYTSGNSKRFEVVKKIELPMTTIESVLDSSGRKIDYLKLDTQGSELDILRGLGKYRPIIIKSEISFVPLYEGGVLFFELGKYLYDLGYIMFHSTNYSRSSPKKHNTDKPFEQTAIPLHGDAWFCPDWTREIGRDIIRGRASQYEALMMMYGMKDIFDYAMNFKPQPMR